MSDEDVIRRRLLIDGDGTGDDRRLNVFLKNLIKWCNMPAENQPENQILHDKMLAQLSQCEFAVRKSLLSANMISSELNSYERGCTMIKSCIEQVKTHIDQSLLDLKEAKTVRKNKIEYDLLAKVIKDQPDRKETDRKLREILNELSALEEQSRQLEKKLDTRRKHFYVLIASANHLRDLIDEHDSITSRDEELMDTSLDIDDLPDTTMHCTETGTDIVSP